MNQGASSSWVWLRRALTGALIASAGLCLASVAGAQESRVPADGRNSDGMDTHLFRPAMDSKGFFYVNGSDVLVHNKVSFGLILDWGNSLMRTSGVGGQDGNAQNPVDAAGVDCTTVDTVQTCNPTSGGTGTGALVDNSFQGTISANYGLFNRASVGLSIPINVMVGERAFGIGETGNTYSTDQLNAQSIAAIVPHVKFRILRASDVVGLALAAQVGFTLGDGPPRDLGADPGVWFWPRVIVDKHFGEESQFKLALNAGYRAHTGSNPSFGLAADGNPQLREGTFSYGDLLTYGFGLSYRAAKYLDLVAENYGSVLLSSAASGQVYSSEFVGGIKLFVEKNSFLQAGAGSRIFTTGFEAADVRVILGFVYEPSIGDRDGDGILDDVDQCPDDPEDFDDFEDADGCPDPDNDNDGILDKDDRCPNIPEDMDGDEDHDGCPEGAKRGDRDGDGIFDDVDKCPDQPEDRDGFEDEDGCPDPDNDKDGILDVEDQCPDDPEDFDKFEDEDGCPEFDNDLDRIPDKQDACPQDPEVYNGFQDEDGCPDKGKVIIEGNDIVILEKINFATASDQILPQSYPIVDAVAATLKGHPEFLVVEIAGHADERGDDDYNLNLTQRRAASVVRAMQQRGVSSARLVSQGYGEYCPLDNASNHQAWDKNRRVEFKVVKTEDGMTGAKRGCVVARDMGILPPTVR